jgi:hypothetical protein
LDGIIKAGLYQDEAMVTYRSTGEDFDIQLNSGYEKEKLWVTEHHLKRPPSQNERVVEIYIADRRKSWEFGKFMAEPAGEHYADRKPVESKDVLSNLLNLRETKLLYSLNSENDNLVKKITYRNVFSNVGCHGILTDFLQKTIEINTTTLYVGNVGTTFYGHIEDACFFSANQLINRGRVHFHTYE